MDMISEDASRRLAVPAAPEFSVAVTCLNEAHCIDEFHARLSATMEKLGRTYEIVFVDDGSSDGTYARFNAIFDADPHVAAIVSLAVNAGQAGAMTAAFLQLKGRHVIVIDSDLQFDPEEIPLLVAEYDKGFDLVSGWRQIRRDVRFRRFSSAMLSWTIRQFSPNALHDTGCTFKIINMEILHSFHVSAFRPIRPSLIMASAQRASEVVVTHHPRRHGKSGWTPRRLLMRFLSMLFDFGGERLGVAICAALPLTVGVAVWFQSPFLLALVCAFAVYVTLEIFFRVRAILLGIPAFVVRAVRLRTNSGA